MWARVCPCVPACARVRANQPDIEPGQFSGEPGRGAHTSGSVVDRIRIREADDTRFVRTYEIVVSEKDKSSWTQVANGSSIGRCRIHRLVKPLSSGAKVQFRVTNFTSPPRLKSIELLNLYGVGGCMKSMNEN